jgi:hypothetical protein
MCGCPCRPWRLTAAARAIEAGVALTPPAAVSVDPSRMSGLRVCLGAAPDLGRTESALRRIAAALGARASPLEERAL